MDENGDDAPIPHDKYGNPMHPDEGTDPDDPEDVTKIGFDPDAVTKMQHLWAEILYKLIARLWAEMEANDSENDDELPPEIEATLEAFKKKHGLDR